ncbi:D-tyrosyl-tRNA(Tyr) deacylase, variant 2 [Bonamia ostreae]|uniref:D-aminoacyl-tRNA deacylase n=1 Tax=Bonamia ostreae TaxID=126728 RepID=A0ABV2AEZ5_9EUKA
MKIMIQRVKKAHVRIQKTNEKISQIGPGICVLLGIHKNDTEDFIEKMAKKCLNLRLWPDGEKNYMKSLQEMDYEILVVSQFSLYSKLKGNRLDFHDAMKSNLAEDFYRKFIDYLKENYGFEKVKEGKFGHRMEVGITNDGPL